MRLRRSQAALALALWIGAPLLAKAADVPPPSDVVALGGEVRATEDGSAVVTVRAAIADGFHVNAHRPDEPYLIPTPLPLRAAGVDFDEPRYPAPKSERFAFSPDKPLLVYSGTIEITAHARPFPSEPIRAELRYQACDDTRCLPPRTISAMPCIE